MDKSMGFSFEEVSSRRTMGDPGSSQRAPSLATLGATGGKRQFGGASFALESTDNFAALERNGGEQVGGSPPFPDRAGGELTEAGGEWPVAGIARNESYMVQSGLFLG